MHSVKDVLKKFNPLKDKYVSREFQAFGVNLAERLEDPRRKGLYIKFAKTCLLYTSPSPRDRTRSRMPSSA